MSGRAQVSVPGDAVYKGAKGRVLHLPANAFPQVVVVVEQPNPAPCRFVT